LIDKFNELTGEVDVLYANFVLSLLEDNRYRELLTSEIIEEFSDGVYDYDALMGQNADMGFYGNEDYNCVSQKLKCIKNILSDYLRITSHRSAEFEMAKDIDFKSVMLVTKNEFLLKNDFDFWHKRKRISMKLKLEEWQLLNRIKDVHESSWIDS
jgi:hypothetical protein